MFKRDFHPHSLISTGLYPWQVAKAYNYPQVSDLGNWVVCVVELGGALDPQNVYNWCDANGIKRPVITKQFVGGATEVSDPNGADGEVALDVCVIAGMAPGANINIVWGPNTSSGFVQAVEAATKVANCAGVSVSWGSAEDDWDSQSMAQMDAIIKASSLAGVPVFVSAGDSGASDGEIGNHVDYPGSSPYAISCGGTRLELNADGTRAYEGVWNDLSTGEGAGGGGLSSIYPKNPWQNGFYLSTNNMRMVPDFSGNADPETGFLVDVNGNKQQIGGTSGVSPAAVALTLLVVAKTGKLITNLQELIYSTTNPICIDITASGNNGYYSVTKGFDCATGMGTFDGNLLFNAFTGTVTSPSPPVSTPIAKKGLFSWLFSTFFGWL